MQSTVQIPVLLLRAFPTLFLASCNFSLDSLGVKLLQLRMLSSDLIQNIDNATQIIKEDPTFSGQDHEKLLASAKRLVSTLESNEEKAWKIIMGVRL